MKRNKVKMIIVITVLFLSIISTIFIVGCAKDSSDNKYNDYGELNVDNEISEEITENSLADSCQYTLVTGYDSDGTCYQLVGEDYESYDGSVIRFGVIKDNQWLINMTSDSPFLDDKKCIYGYEDADGIYKSEYYKSLKQTIEQKDPALFDKFGYAGNGCFYLESNSGSKTDSLVEKLSTIVFWNAETNTSKLFNNTIMYDMENYTTGNDVILSVLTDHLFNISNDKFADMNVQALNVSTLETKSLLNQMFDANSNWDYKVHQSSENLFYVEKDNSFYDTTGKKAFEITVDKVQEIGKFKNGQCELITQVESGSKYSVMIDTKGNVISNEKIG